MSGIESEINDLLTALRLQPRKAWADELSIPSVAGRCAGSYGCGGGGGNPPVQQGGSFILDLSSLVAAGVQVEHAIAALVRKYEGDQRLAEPMQRLIRVARDPASTREQFSEALAALAGIESSSVNPEVVIEAILDGRLDNLTGEK